MTASLMLAAATVPLGLRAQARTPDVLLTRTSPVSMTIAPGSNVTATFQVKNLSHSAARLVTRFNAPAGWVVVLGSEAFTIPADSSDLLLISASVPARISAGHYTFGIVFERDQPGGPIVLSDSLVVQIEEHRAVDLKLITRPSYVVAGSSYRLSLALLNRGNSPGDFRVSASASTASAIRFERRLVRLNAGESKLVEIEVGTRKGGDRAIEDILEIHAVHEADSSVHADLSTTVTIVQPAGLQTPRTLLPTRVRLRGSPYTSGVSPYEVSGGGKISEDRPETLNFLFRGSPGIVSSFGDRDEYRMDFSSRHYTVRTGDQLYSLSQLLSGGQIGFGGGVDATQGHLAAGAYSNRFRYQPGNSSEYGGYTGAQFGSGDRASRLALNAVTRPNGPFAGRLLGSTAQFHPLPGVRVDMEFARSASKTGTGSASSARIVGLFPFRYDAGHVSGNAQFAGPARGTTQDYVTLNGNPVGRLQLSASANRNSHKSQVDTLFNSDKAFNTNLAAAWGALSIEHVTTRRNEGSRGALREVDERGFVLRMTETRGAISVWSAAERGTGRDSSGGGKIYGEYSGGGNLSLKNLRFSGYADYYNGGSINRGPVALLNLGADGAVVFPFGVMLSVNAFKSSPRDSIAASSLQVDTRLTKTLSNGASIGFRVRHSKQTSLTGPAANVGYLEYSLPLGLPLGRSTAGGRAVGRVVDRETGRGMPNTLVRVGPQAALTDRDGRVYFNGLPTGEYRAAIAQDAAVASSVVIGNPDVKIDSADHRRIRSFHLAVDRPGIVRGTVRQMSLARTGVGSEPDSLTDSGPLDGVTVSLVNGQDTVYRVTDANGEIVADELPPGAWTVAIADDAPPMQRYEPPQKSVAVARGGIATVSFSLVPARRRIKMIGDEKVPLALPPVKRK